MYAYDYGIRNFEKKYQPFPNITVFNDSIEILDQEKTQFVEEFVYKQVTLDEVSPLLARIVSSGITYTDIFVKEYLQKFGQFTSTGQTRKIVGLPVEREIFQFEGNYFVFNPEITVLDEVEITAKGTGSRTKFPPDLTILSEQLEGAALSVILFITKDGVKLERTYQKIDQLAANEIVLFIEKDDAYNIFGSVVRVNSGSNITENTNIPYNDIAKLSKTFEIGVRRKDIKEVLEDHVTNKESVFYLIRDAFVKGVSITRIPVNYTLQKVADGMDTVAKGIQDNLKIGDGYWKAYDKDGKENATYTPLLPGYDLFENQNTSGDDADYSQLFDKVYERLDGLEVAILLGIEKIPMDMIREYVRGKTKVFFSLIQEAKGFLGALAKEIKELVKDTFIFLNAFLVGLLNSLVDIIKGIFDLIGLLCKIVVGLNKAQEQSAKTPASMFSLFVELFENALETTFKLFTIKNIKALFKFMLLLFIKFLIAPPSISLDKLGYGIGYLIGFIVEEVVFAILTGGVKTIAEALKQTAKLYSSLLKGTYKAAKKTIQFSIDGIITIIKLIQEKLKQFPQLLDDLGKWLDEVLASVKAEAAVSSRFQGLFSLDPISATILRKIGKKTLDRLADAGVKFGKNSKTLKYEIQYNGVTIRSFETEKELVKELSQIIKKKGDELTKYLDELLQNKNFTDYIKLRSKFEITYNTSSKLNLLWRKRITSKKLKNLKIFYDKMLKKYPELEGKNFAIFKTKIFNKGKVTGIIEERSSSGAKNVKGFLEKITDKNFVENVVDINGRSRKNDSEIKYIYNFLKNHLNKGDYFIIETTNIMTACSSCRRELLMLKELLGDQVKIIVNSIDELEEVRHVEEYLKYKK